MNPPIGVQWAVVKANNLSLLPFLAHAAHITARYPIIGNVIAAIVAGGFAIYVAHNFTKSIKQVDATFEFSKRYHELMEKRYEANEVLTGEKLAHWWQRYFDLMFFQYQFYIRGLLYQERFSEWMGWRNKESKEQKDYIKSWIDWQNKSPFKDDSEFVSFMDAIHDARTAQGVASLVNQERGHRLRAERHRMARQGRVTRTKFEHMASKATVT
jgi:hypothetical protein